MARYRNKLTGVVVDIPAELAEQIGNYEPVKQPAKQEGKTPQRKSTKKSD